MNDVMPRVLKQLISDHRNMSKLLDVLNEELERYRHAGALDFDVLTRILDYIRNYPDLRHHPREDLLFKHLQRKHPVEVDAVSTLLLEHEELAALTRRFSAAIRNLMQGFAMPRPEFEALIALYIGSHRSHMRQEEQVYFPLLRKHLEPMDWRQVELDATKPGADPLFGGKIDAEYQTLHDRIMSLAR